MNLVSNEQLTEVSSCFLNSRKILMKEPFMEELFHRNLMVQSETPGYSTRHFPSWKSHS